MSEEVPQQQPNPHVEALRQDLGCPSCGYNLRGLTGAVVNCPECGHKCDVAEMITRKWTGPWYRAPGLTYIERPSVAPFVAGFALLILSPSTGRWLQDLLLFLISAGVIMLGVWAGTMVLVWQRIGGWSGVPLVLVGHLVMLTYLVGIIGVVTTGAMLIHSWSSNVSGLFFLKALSLLILFMLLLWAGWHGERWLAKQCIQRYLCAPTS